MAANDDRHAPWSRAGGDVTEQAILVGHPNPELELEQIEIPEEDSRLHARARVDFGQVRIGERQVAALAGCFHVRMHVPRALQQQISGNGLVGSVLGSARIVADISERVGSRGGVGGAAEVCLFVGFHEVSRGSWMVDLRVVRGSRLRVPVRAETALTLTPKLVPVPAIQQLDLGFDEDARGSFGPIPLLSGSVSDLWRSVRDHVRTLLAERLEALARHELARLRAGRPSRSDAGGTVLERRNGLAPCSLAC